jgi:ABC-type lipoprotein release transport system permease subunit
MQAIAQFCLLAVVGMLLGIACGMCTSWLLEHIFRCVRAVLCMLTSSMGAAAAPPAVQPLPKKIDNAVQALLLCAA